MPLLLVLCPAFFIYAFAGKIADTLRDCLAKLLALAAYLPIRVATSHAPVFNIHVFIATRCALTLLCAALRVVRTENRDVVLHDLGLVLRRASSWSVQLLNAEVRAMTYAALVFSKSTIEVEIRLFNDIACALTDRFEQFGNEQDIDHAIALLEQLAYKLENGCSTSRELRGQVLHNLGLAYRHRFLLDPDSTNRDIEDALRCLRKAQSCLSQLRITTTLANTLLIAAEQQQDYSECYLEEAIRVYQILFTTGTFSDVTLLKTDPLFPHLLDSLGAVFQRRYKCKKGLKDESLTIELRQLSIRYTPVIDKVFRSRRYLNLALAHYVLYQHTGTNAASHLRNAVDAARVAAQDDHAEGPVRFRAAYLWAVLSPGDLAAYRIFVSLLPSVVWVGYDIQKHYAEMPDIALVIRRGAAAATEAAQYEEAIAWFNAGRCYVWQHTFSLGTTFYDSIPTTLSEGSLFIISELEGLTRRLRAAFLCTLYSVPPSKSHTASCNQSELALDHKAILSRASDDPELKTLPLIQNLLRLTGTNVDSLESLQPFRTDCRDPSYSASSFTVCINTTPERIDALSICHGSKEITHIPLPSFSFERASQMAQDLDRLLQQTHLRDKRFMSRYLVHDRRVEPISVMIPTEDILCCLWTDLVKPMLEQLNLIHENQHLSPADSVMHRPRIFWCANGPLTCLPLHAAGCFHDQSRHSLGRAFSYIVSSYLPILQKLAHESIQPPPPPLSTSSILAILGEGLSHAEGEICKLQERFNGKVTVLRHPDAAPHDMLEALQTCTDVHFACHGKQETKDSTQSAFVLSGTASLTVADLMCAFQPGIKRGMAVLSACETAMGDRQLTDEVVHLAASMLGFGFRSIVGTTWKVWDEDAAYVADVFYREVIDSRTGLPNISRAAFALDAAIGELRDSGVPVLRWASFIHIGE